MSARAEGGEATLFDHAKAMRVPQLSERQKAVLLKAAKGAVYLRIAGGWEQGRHGPRVKLDTMKTLARHRLMAEGVVGGKLTMKITQAGEVLAARYVMRRQS